MHETAYEVRINDRGGRAAHMVVHRESSRFLGAYGGNYFRSWVFPLYTPSGLTVVREFPFDHPFHNGVFVGQHPVRSGEREANYWAMPVPRSADDHIMTCIGRMDAPDPVVVELGDEGVQFTLRSVWRDENEEPVLDEERVVTMCAPPDATVCDVTSRKHAAYGPVEFPQTKFGSIGLRVEPRLLPSLGGQIIGIQGEEERRGTADECANAKACDCIAYEAAHPAVGRWGVAACVLDNSASPRREGPWFIRDYGMAMFNSTQDEGICVKEGDTWTATLRVIAYEGPLSADRAQAWRQFPSLQLEGAP